MGSLFLRIVHVAMDTLEYGTDSFHVAIEPPSIPLDTFAVAFSCSEGSRVILPEILDYVDVLTLRRL